MTDRSDAMAVRDPARRRPAGVAASLRGRPDRSVTLPAELLRVESPSAEVQRPFAERTRSSCPASADVAIAAIEPVGNYAVRLTFDDGHSTGIYGWGYLAELGADPEGTLAAYRETLSAAGLSHEPPGRGG